ncbi:XylR family transcriptional regulator [Cerasicoccus frondis]|uniref:XylR family transcriptional regulator n=1 Tax=Cerasicoccus frondis TaxID=490090 RepID=UPI00285298CA|nr:XylR family transcriptional regulator [Cerasicoccus frondis]
MPALEHWRPDGVIVHLAERELANRLPFLNIPLISVTDTIRSHAIPTVDVDNEAVGKIAAEVFLSQGLRSFAYYGSSKASFSLNREQGFHRRLKEAGYTSVKLHANFLPQSPYTENWELEDRHVERWLKALPKPVGILASNDIPARALCELCRRANIRVPTEAAILGVDNDLAICRMSRPTLSSVDIPAETIGRTAAQQLANWLEEKERPPAFTALPPLQIINRNSTDADATDDEIVQKALGFIAKNAMSDLNVEAVCKAIGESRRKVERQFKRSLSVTILERIHQEQMVHAKRLLLETELPIGMIAERCGFNNQRRFNRIFQQHQKLTPSAYRILR